MIVSINFIPNYFNANFSGVGSSIFFVSFLAPFFESSSTGGLAKSIAYLIIYLGFIITSPYFSANFAECELFPDNLGPFNITFKGIYKGTFSIYGATLSGYVF